MNTKQELTIPFDTANARTLLIFTPIFLGIVTVLFLVTRLLIMPELSLCFSYDLLFSNVVIGFSILYLYMTEFLFAFLLILLSYMYFDVLNDLRRNIPVAVFDIQGVRTHRHGVIAWKNIKDVALFKQVSPTKGNALRVEIKIKKIH